MHDTQCQSRGLKNINSDKNSQTPYMALGSSTPRKCILQYLIAGKNRATGAMHEQKAERNHLLLKEASVEVLCSVSVENREKNSSLAST